MQFSRRILGTALAFVALMTSCKKWDDHTQVETADLTKDLYAVISTNDSLSTFTQYVNQTGLDSLLKSSRTFTVFAPTNTALASLDPAVVSDIPKLRQFLLNHIANQSYFTREAVMPIRIPMVNGKYQDFTSGTFGGAAILSADRYVRNGVLHVINNKVEALPSIWDFVNTSGAQFAQNAYLNSLTFQSLDPSLAIVDSISAITGLPVYRPGTGLVSRNRFNDRVYDLRREDRQYTYFVSADADFTREADSLRTYFANPSAAITDSLTRWFTVRDLVIEGAYDRNSLPAVITSRFGTSYTVNPANIIETKRFSNGIVHILSSSEVLTAQKFRPITLQGENPSGFSVDRTANTNYRSRRNPVTGAVFEDLMVSGHGVTSFYAFYRLNEMPSIKYRVYALGVNDFQTGAFTQNMIPKLMTGPGTYTTLATLPHAVPLNTAAGAYDEKLLGEFTMTTFGTLELQLTASGTNPLVLDYVRLVPVP